MPKAMDPVKKVERALERYETRVVRHLNKEFGKNLRLGDRVAVGSSVLAGPGPSSSFCLVSTAGRKSLAGQESGI